MVQNMKCSVISVVLPVYNGEKYLTEAISSILSQSFKDFELIIIDDGSTDKSISIIEKFQDDRIKFLKNEENKGLVFSLNRGIKESSGKYIARMDCDDIALPHRLKIQYEFMENNPEIGLCGTFVKRFGSILRRGLLKVPVSNDEIKANSLFFCSFVHPAVMLRKEVLIKNNLKYSEDFKGAEDYNLWIDMMGCGIKVANIPVPLLKYRVSKLSVSGNIFFNKEKFAERLKLISIIQEKAFKSAFPGMEFDAEVHALIYKMKFHTEFLKIEEIRNISKWLKKLIKYNRVSKYCDEMVFEKAVFDIFFHVCSFSTYLGMELNEEFNKFGSFSNFRKMKMMVKCLIRFGNIEMMMKRMYLKRNRGMH
jgi:glycosyltransferase involved in cell wall biosynthesis